MRRVILMLIVFGPRMRSESHNCARGAGSRDVSQSRCFVAKAPRSFVLKQVLKIIFVVGADGWFWLSMQSSTVASLIQDKIRRPVANRLRSTLHSSCDTHREEQPQDRP